ncbi:MULTISPECIES: amidase [unclassified Spirosoma]|uniref:amidase n=1 Tax=unclassified Spirosoma TaxID=2621999 RepID=UPI000966EB26|nr:MULTISPECIES: amidase family protein [unclassified Spirosoma]OJW70186.1 MAG: amidase [Spirosoma sp. 48-14]
MPNRFLPLFLPLFLLTIVARPQSFKPKQLQEATIDQLHTAMQKGKLTAVELVQLYLDRIEAYDKQGPFLNAIIMVNPKALTEARRLDSLYKATGTFVGPLHGIPVIVKDNYNTFDMPTTNGTLAMKKSIPPKDAFVVKRIREAGAIIIAKSNLAEFATSGQVSVSSILPGYSRNPYDTKRTTAGSSGGTAAAVAADFGTIGLGTDTGSSIRGPSSHQSLVGFRPTLGLVSRDGIAPLALTNDTGGPICRTVEDAVRILDVIAGYDKADTVTRRSEGKIPVSYRQYLDKNGLKGARIGVFRQLCTTKNSDPQVYALFNKALDELRAAGATIIDSVRVPELDTINKQFDTIPQLRRDFNVYLANLGPNAPHKSLTSIIKSRQFHPSIEKTLLDSDKDTLAPEAHKGWEKNLALRERLRKLLLRAMDSTGVDALVYPSFSYPPRLLGDLNTPSGTNNNALSPPTGFPAFSVPMGFTYTDLPAGLQFFGRPFSESTLIRLCYAYEQATHHRHPPDSTPVLPKKKRKATRS